MNVKNIFKLSIIIPVYNRPQLLEETLNSTKDLNNQIEIIVIDDGSKKNNASVQKKLANKYNAKYFYQENKGLSEARNAGIRKAKGKFLFFLDSDDLLTLEIVDFFNTNKEWELYDVSRFWVRYLENKKSKCKTKHSSIFLSEKDRMYLASTASFLIRRVFLIENELWWEGRLYEDNYWYFKILSIITTAEMRVFKIYSIYYRAGNLSKEKLTLKTRFMTFEELEIYLLPENYKKNIWFTYLSLYVLGRDVIPKIMNNKEKYINTKIIKYIIIFSEYVFENINLLKSEIPYKKNIKKYIKTFETFYKYFSII